MVSNEKFDSLCNSLNALAGHYRSLDDAISSRTYYALAAAQEGITMLRRENEELKAAILSAIDAIEKNTEEIKSLCGSASGKEDA